MFLLLISPLWLRSKPSSFYPFMFFVLQFVLAIFIDEKVLRSLSITMAFQAMICAISIYHLALLFIGLSKANGAKKMQVTISVLVLILIATFIKPLTAISGFKNATRQAADYVLKKSPDTGIITTNFVDLISYVAPYKIYGIQAGQPLNLQALADKGYDYILIYPMTDNPVVGRDFKVIEEYCESEGQFDSASVDWQRWAILESKMAVKEKWRALQEASLDKGKIRIYETAACLSQLEKVLPAD